MKSRCISAQSIDSYTMSCLKYTCIFVYKLLCNALSVLKWAGVKYFLKEHSYFFHASASLLDVCKYIFIFLSMGDMKKNITSELIPIHCVFSAFDDLQVTLSFILECETNSLLYINISSVAEF